MKRLPPNAGLTLIEIILTLAIVGMLMVALAFHTFSLSRIWMDDTDHDFFQQHAEGVAMFLNTALTQSRPSAAEGREGLPVQWGRPPDWSEMDPPLIMFRQTEAPPLFAREGIRLPDVVCYLYFEPREGLSLLWYSELQESFERVDDLYRTKVSRWIERIEYCYFDAEMNVWETLEEPRRDENDEYELPHFLRLHFAYEDESTSRNVFIPQSNRDVPLF